MPPSPPHEVTQLLVRAREGDPAALDLLFPLVYSELKALARKIRTGRGASETLNTTALVHEAYEKFAGANVAYADRQHFFRIAAKAMRQIVIDHARAQQAAKRGGGVVESVSLDLDILAPPEKSAPLLALDAALTHLAELDERQGAIVELRYFIGLTIAEAAEVQELSPATVKREWAAARAWLHREIAEAA